MAHEVATCAPSWPWPEMMNAILPARCMSHMRSSTARARSIARYMPRTSSSLRPRSPCRGLVSVWAIRMRLLDVDGRAVDGQGGLGEHFGQGRVGVDAHRDLG